MDNKITGAVEEIFAKHEQSRQLSDFKEEVVMNLNERVKDLVKKGMSENEAVDKAVAELGDIAEIAENAGVKKHNEVIAELFNQNKPLDKFHALGYAAATALTVAGIFAAVLSWLNSGDIGGILLVLAPFLIIAVAAYTFLGLTQDSNTVYPMKKMQGALFGLAVGLVLTGLLIGSGFYFRGVTTTALEGFDWTGHFESAGATAVTVALIAFIPGLAMLIYLGLTQEDRAKPWFKEWLNKNLKEQSSDGFGYIYGERFGLISGFIWILAITLYLLIGFVFNGWHPGWIVFLFAVTAQLLTQFVMSGKKS